MSTKIELEDSIRNNFAIIFGRSESVESGLFRQKYNALVEYATAVSAPFLGPETIRYQSMLLYISILFLSVDLFQVGKFKIGETLIAVDARLLVIYAIFIGMLILIFLIKAYVDYQRALFVRARNDQVSSELKELIGVGLLVKQIQEYFWLEVFDAIGRSYKVYDDALSKALGKIPDFAHIPMQAIKLNRTDFSRNPVTRAEIAKQDTYLASLTADLASDEKRFREEADLILNTTRADARIPPSFRMDGAYEQIRAAFDRHLTKWFEARNALTDEHLDVVMKNMAGSPEVLGLQAMVKVVKPVVTIRRLYAAMEIGVPVLFAVVAILSVLGPSISLP